ncbi:MAG TPA: nickel pincer cofactor biosynthesis protein LarB [Gemmatimonadaceae bacterium]|nr:nickel pincer cofactor biosynthesis protein LarB [Gemmatimonadaceae bacterium]
MIREQALALLQQVAAGTLDPRQALDALALAPAAQSPYATVDHHRALRQGFPEVIYAAGKTTSQVLAIASELEPHGDGVLITRCDVALFAALGDKYPTAEINELGRTVYVPPLDPSRVPKGKGTVLIVTAGTSDLPVAEEAAATAKALGDTVARATDVGVAGIHRVLAHGRDLMNAAVVIVVAGMDGALPSVVGGLVGAPVIAVPTSVGYGASFQGLAPLLAMLNSCAAGVSVVNIDNGFGAAMAASRITHASVRFDTSGAN